MNERIEFVELRQNTNYAIRPNAYAFEPKGRLQWFQKLLWKYLNAAGTIKTTYIDVVTTTRHTVEPYKFIDALYRQKSYLFAEFGRRGDTLLIGAEDYAKIISDPNIINSEFSFGTEYRRGDRIAELNVKIIPWMRGFVVV